MHINHKHFQWSQIDDQIYIGTNQCCEIHFSEDLLKKGMKADISLEDVKVDAPFGVDYYLWLPTRDHTPPTEKQLNLGVMALDNLIEAKEKVYVHCKNGHGRAPTLVAAYFIFKGMGVDEVIEFLKSKRGGVYLSEEQKNALEKFKKSL